MWFLINVRLLRLKSIECLAPVIVPCSSRLFRRSSVRSVKFDQMSVGGGSIKSLRLRPESPAWFNTLKNKIKQKN